jgi:heme A synthase
MARAAGRFAGRYLPRARAAANAAIKSQSGKMNRDWIPAAQHSRQFVKHVVPAAVKPLHALWHQALGFLFLVIAGMGAWKVWRAENIAPPMIIVAVIFIGIMAIYGISSILKANKISKS